MLQLGVQTRTSGAEIRDTQGRGNACAGEDDDVFGLIQQLDGIVDRVVLRQLGPLGKLPADSQDQETPIGLIFLALEAFRRADAKGSEKLLGRNDARFDSAAAKLLWAKSTQLVAISDGLVRSAEVGV